MTAAVLAMGIKYTCTSCATRFYDLNKRPITCPKCQQVCTPIAKKSTVRRSRRKIEDRVADSSDVTTRHAIVVADAKPKPVRWK